MRSVTSLDTYLRVLTECLIVGWVCNFKYIIISQYKKYDKTTKKNLSNRHVSIAKFWHKRIRLNLRPEPNLPIKTGPLRGADHGRLKPFIPQRRKR